MNDRLDFDSLLHSSRSQVYLVWAVLTAVGYVATHYYQDKNINFVWFILSAAGFYFMYKAMPLRLAQMKKIFAAWLTPISFGIGVSIVAVRTDLLPEIVPYLGVFWLVISAVGYIWNGIVDAPSTWYYIAAALSLVFAGLCYFLDSFLIVQYLIAAVVTVWCMLNLWIFRSDV